MAYMNKDHKKEKGRAWGDDQLDECQGSERHLSPYTPYYLAGLGNIDIISKLHLMDSPYRYKRAKK